MTTYTFDVNNAGTVGIDSDVTIEGLDDISVDTKVTLEPVTTSSTIAVEPLSSTLTSASTVSSTSSVDLEPVTVDSCVRVELAPLPPTRLRTPWEQRIGLSVLGVELLAWTWRGETRSYVEPAPKQPLVVEGAVAREWADRDDHGHGHGAHGHRARDGHGLVVRVEP
ncbi:MAG TPA: hypothetical protein VMI11_07275 [Actinomycetes bacterium]|nr:hypothetical protein [Actinomycetes bacterium]